MIAVWYRFVAWFWWRWNYRKEIQASLTGLEVAIRRMDTAMLDEQIRGDIRNLRADLGLPVPIIHTEKPCDCGHTSTHRIILDGTSECPSCHELRRQQSDPDYKVVAE